MPTSFVLTVLWSTVTAPDWNSRIPVDANVCGVYTLPETKLWRMLAVAPPLAWMPFWAMTAVGPTPKIRFAEICALDPALLTVGPFF